MENEINQLIDDIFSEKLNPDIDLGWFDDKKITNIKLLIQNLERVRSRKDFSYIKIDSLKNNLSLLLQYYLKKVSYKELVINLRYHSPVEINRDIDDIILKLKNLDHIVFADGLITKLLNAGVNNSLISEAMTVPEIEGGIDKVKNFIVMSIGRFGKTPLGKEEIFNLVLLRIMTNFHMANMKMPAVNQIREHFDGENTASSYKSSVQISDIVEKSVIKLIRLYPNYNKLFLARDGLIMYEAAIALGQSNCDVIYVSRDTLGGYFKKLTDELDLIIGDVGVDDMDKIIQRLVSRFKVLYSRDAYYSKIFTTLYTYLKSYIKPNTVFVDSSSKTLPVVLCALCKMFYPLYDFRPFFSFTIYTQSNVGLITGQKDFSVDMMPDYVEYASKKSSLFPYIQKFSSSQQKMKKEQAYMTHLVLLSTLRS